MIIQDPCGSVAGLESVNHCQSPIKEDVDGRGDEALENALEIDLKVDACKTREKEEKKSR